MLAIATGIEAMVIIDAIEALALIGKSVQSFIQISSTKDVQGINLLNEQELELANGQFCKEILYNNIPINDLQFCEVMNERILQIDRVCQSKWQYFPSGILTPITWALTGSALRHEFVILDTQNHICLIELKKVNIQEENKQIEVNKLSINFHYCQTDILRKNLRNYLLMDRFCDRILASIKLDHQLYFGQINYFTNLLLLSWKQIHKQSSTFSNMDLLGKISKQYARSVFYFSQPQPDYDIIMQSIFGVFTDKPLFLPRLDLIALEKSFWHGVQLSNEKKQQFEKYINVIKSLRNGIDFSQTTIQ